MLPSGCSAERAIQLSPRDNYAPGRRPLRVVLPTTPKNVAVILAVATATPVTTRADSSIDAVAGFEEHHATPALNSS